MAAPIRKKRNFKGLGLDVSAPAPAPPEPQPTRLAPTAGAPAGKKRPPPMTLAAPKIPAGPATNEGDNVLLTVSNGPSSAPATGISPSAKRMTYHTALSNTLANLDLSAETKIELKGNEDLEDMHELGQGNGGSVKKVKHIPTGTILAKKVCPHRVSYRSML
jgi:mitogen-activated protein kinase kinase